LPQVTCVAALWDVHTADQLQAAQTAAPSLGMPWQAVEVRHPPHDFERAMDVAVRERAQALVVWSSPLFFASRAQVAESAVKHRLPTIVILREYAEAGGLMAYGVNLVAMYRRAADDVARLLQGATPADLPMEQPTTFEVVHVWQVLKNLVCQRAGPRENDVASGMKK
jgi:putative tryptophan/tyrosine transport system substrate-binding protein